MAMLFKIKDTSTNPLAYGKHGVFSTCDMSCPECLKPMVRTVTERGTHRWAVDAPGVQIECRNCGFEWIVERYMVTLRRVK